MLILASKSSIRQHLMAQAGISYTCVPSCVNEREISISEAEPLAGAALLAREKALEVAARNPASLVIGADQMLSFKNRVLHKAENMNSARQRLLDLSGNTHFLNTAVCLAKDGQLLWQHTERAQLTMNANTLDDIEAILASEGEQLLYSVGAYRLEGPSLRLFSKLEGDYFAMLGLPLLPLLNALRQFAPEVFNKELA